MDYEGLHYPSVTWLLWEERHHRPGSGTEKSVNRPAHHSRPRREKSAQWWQLAPCSQTQSLASGTLKTSRFFFPPQYYFTIKADAPKQTSGGNWVTQLLPTMPCPASWHRLETTNTASQTSEILTCLTLHGKDFQLKFPQTVRINLAGPLLGAYVTHCPKRSQGE